MIWHILLKVVQNFVFLWYDTAYLSKSGANIFVFFYGMIWCTVVKTMQIFVYNGTNLLISDHLVDSNACLDFPSESFTFVINQDHGPHLHVIKCRNSLLQTFECIKNLLSSLLNESGMHLL